MYQARRAEYIQVYESIVIELFFRLKIHEIVTYITRFDIENCNFLVACLNHAT